MRGPTVGGAPEAGGEDAALHGHSPSPEKAVTPPATYNLIRGTKNMVTIITQLSPTYMYIKMWWHQKVDKAFLTLTGV